MLVLRPFLIALAIFASAAAAHAEDCTLPGTRTLERPNGTDGPTEISASLIVADLLGVDDVDQKIEVDLIATFRWTDPRLDQVEGCQFPVTDVWFPRLSLLNSSSLVLERVNARNRVDVGADGAVFYRQRYTGTISTYHNLRRFPFDRHAFDIEVVTLLSGADDIQFFADTDKTWVADRLNIEGWMIENAELFTENRFVKQAGEELSVLTLRINAKRDFDFFIFRVLLPLIIVVAMSWVVFWVPPDRFEFQIGIGATSMLTVIAFNLTVGSSLPALGYLTTLDKMIIWAILLVFLSIAEALLAGLADMNGSAKRARAMDRTSRVLFPLLLALGWLVIILTA